MKRLKKRPEGAATPTGRLNKYSTIINYTLISSILQFHRIDLSKHNKELYQDVKLLNFLTFVVLIRSGLFRTFLLINNGGRRN